MYILEMVSAIKKTTIKKLKHFMFENFYGIEFSRESSYYSMRHKEKKDFNLSWGIRQQI